MSSSDFSAIPPLQAFSRLTAHAFGDNASSPETLQLLGHYLQSQSCNIGEVEVLRQWDQQRNGSSGVDLAGIERAVASRTAAVRAVLEQNREKVSIMVSTATPAATATAANRGGGLQESSHGLTTTVVQWWQLGCNSSPWDFALRTDSEKATGDPKVHDGDYHFLSLREAVELIEPFLNVMRCAAALGAEDLVSNAFMDGVAYVSTLHTQGEAAAMFASLELERTYVTLSFGGRAGIAGVTKVIRSLRAVSELRRVSSLLERFESREGGTQDTDQPSLTTAGMTDPMSITLTKAQAYWGLATSYSVFFHTVSAYLDGVTGNFEGFAVALLGTGEQPGLYLWGASRFPFLPFAAADNGGGSGGGNEGSGSGTLAPAKGEGGRCGGTHRNSSNAPVMVKTRLAALFPASSSYVTSSGADYYLGEYKPLVTGVIGPARTFSTLLVLSAVATLPLHAVAQQLPLWVELRELYENCEELGGLLDALHEGKLGTAWRQAEAAAQRYLAGASHIQPAVLQKLLQKVQQALCFHYLNTRGVTNMAHAAEDLCLDSTEQFVGVATGLIRDQFMDARIDLVSGTIQVQNAGTGVGNAENTEEAAARAVLGLSTLEMQLTCMSAERNLIFVPHSQDN